jgi:hypothetical protein
MNMRDGFSGGMEMDEAVEVAKTLEQIGVYALVLSGGFVSRAPMYVMRGAMPLATLAKHMDNILWVFLCACLAKCWCPMSNFRRTTL